MNGDATPEFAIGAVSMDGEPAALLIRSKPTFYINAESIPSRYSYSIDPKDTGILN